MGHDFNMWAFCDSKYGELYSMEFLARQSLIWADLLTDTPIYETGEIELTEFTEIFHESPGLPDAGPLLICSDFRGELC